MQGVNCTRHYPYLNEEVLHLVHRLVDGVVVALIGDVVLASCPCWLHITREGLLPGRLLSRFGLHSSRSLSESTDILRPHGYNSVQGRNLHTLTLPVL